MAISITGNSATIGAGDEYWLASASVSKTDQTDDAMLTVWIDFGAMLAGDQYKVRLVEKINAGTQRTVFEAIVTGAQANPWVMPAFIVGEGWEVGVVKLAGTDRSIAWSLRKAT